MRAFVSITGRTVKKAATIISQWLRYLCAQKERTIQWINNSADNSFGSFLCLLGKAKEKSKNDISFESEIIIGKAAKGTSIKDYSGLMSLTTCHCENFCNPIKVTFRLLSATSARTSLKNKKTNCLKCCNYLLNEKKEAKRNETWIVRAMKLDNWMEERSE